MVFLNIVSTPGPGLSRLRLGLAMLVTRLVKARARTLTIVDKLKGFL